MNITKFGDKYLIYDDSVLNISQLDSAIYKVEFNEQFGLYLVKYSDKFSIKEKIFGDYEGKVNRAYQLFNDTDKNLGILMTGKKGMGKSFCAKELCNKCLENHYPVILVDSSFDTESINVKEIPEFFGKIKQDLVIFFDEFDKVFRAYSSDNGHNDIDPQEDLLSMFDGVDTLYKRLFIVTSNHIRDINEYFLNRPGRFHYHFRFTFPTEEEIRDYIHYYYSDISPDEMEEIILFTDIHPLTYDCLNAVVTELKYGRKFKDSIKELNISNDDDEFVYSFKWVFGVLNFEMNLRDDNQSDAKTLEYIVNYITNPASDDYIKYNSFDETNRVNMYDASFLLNPANPIIKKPLSYYKVDKKGVFRIPIKVENIKKINLVFDGNRRNKNDSKYLIEKELNIDLMNTPGVETDKLVTEYALDCAKKNKAYFEIKITKNSEYWTKNVLEYLL